MTGWDAARAIPPSPRFPSVILPPLIQPGILTVRDDVSADTTPAWRDLIRRPTAWVLVVLLLGFVYLQWPTRVRPVETIDYVTVEHEHGVRVDWEDDPSARTDGAGIAWTLQRKGLDFLVQQGALDRPLPELARRMLDTDRDQVGGAVYEPVRVDNGQAAYALFDAENRIQRHRLYRVDGHWLKASVLYKMNSEQREERAHYFLDSVELPAGP